MGYAATDTFTYTISDPRGLTDTDTVTIYVNGPPDAVDDCFATVADFPSIAANVITGVLSSGVAGDSIGGVDSDPDGDAITVISNTAVSSGTLGLNADGSLTFAFGISNIATFTYTISDPRGLTDTATVELRLSDLDGVCQ